MIPRPCGCRIILGIALAGTRVMNRMSVEDGGGRAGGVSEAPLCIKALKPGPQVAAGGANAEAYEPGKNAGWTHGKRHTNTP